MRDFGVASRAQVSIYVAVAHQTSHLAPDTRITTIDSSQTAKLGTAYSFQLKPSGQSQIKLSRQALEFSKTNQNFQQ